MMHFYIVCLAVLEANFVCNEQFNSAGFGLHATTYKIQIFITWNSVLQFLFCLVAIAFEKPNGSYVGCGGPDLSSCRLLPAVAWVSSTRQSVHNEPSTERRPGFGLACVWFGRWSRFPTRFGIVCLVGLFTLHPSNLESFHCEALIVGIMHHLWNWLSYSLPSFRRWPDSFYQPHYQHLAGHIQRGCSSSGL